MILIFSMLNDSTTTVVCNWLNFHKQDFIRINSEDKITFDCLNILEDNFSFIHQDRKIEAKDILAVWYRRGGFQYNLKMNAIYCDSHYLHESGQVLSYYIKSEYDTLISFMQHKIEKDHSIGAYETSSLNKLKILDKAKDFGLLIPKTWVISNRTQLLELHKKYELISKAIKEGLYHTNDSHGYYTYTNEIKANEIEKFPEHFPPSLIQEKVSKKYELRIFYLRGKFFSMAIFSQNNSQTSVDFRNYDQSRPNRFVPYQLPKEIENKIDRLFKSIDLNTGSVDMLVDINDNCLFLEINPIGQFTMTSQPCNYDLERLLAEELILIKNEKEKKKINISR